jgi:aspartyl-tRNA(Asn)/glutamyl-tRNA(Gln) amidotransferase subunit C
MLSKEEVQHIAKLARLELSEAELEKYKTDLSSILDYVTQLQELDVSLVQPTSHAVPLENIMREDEIQRETPERINALLESAPHKERGYIRTKGILGTA